jgi:hypothetical protein
VLRRDRPENRQAHLSGHRLWKASHNIGQIDFYVRCFEDQVKLAGDDATIGSIFCADKNDTMAKYSALSENEHLFASKDMLCLPTEEE